MTIVFRCGLLCTLLVSACWSSSSRGPQSSGNTNWLKLCASDDSCGSEASCVCGVCTRACDSSNECAGATCSDAQAACASEHKAEHAGICLRPCSATRQCGTGLRCEAGSCIAIAAQAARSIPEVPRDDCDATVASCDPSVTLSSVIDQSRRASTPADPDARVWSCEGGALRIDPASYDEPFALAVAGDSLLIAGAATSASGDGAWRIERRTLADLAPALAFGMRGAVTSDRTTGWDGAGALASDGEFVYVAGVDGYGAALGGTVRVEKRSLTSGALASDFGESGVIELAFGADSTQWLPEPPMGHGLILDAEHLYLGGTGFAVEKRRASDGAPVAAFGDAGVARSMAGVSAVAAALALRDGVLYAAGSDGALGLRLEARDAQSGALLYETTEALAAGSCHPAHVTLAAGADDALYLAAATAAGRFRIERRRASDGQLVYAREAEPSGSCDAATAIAIDDDAMYVAGTFDGRWRIEKRSLADGELVGSFGAIDSGVQGAGGAVALNAGELYVAGIEGKRESAESSVWRVERRSRVDGTLGECPNAAPDVPRAPECASRPRVASEPSARCTARVASSTACAANSVRASVTANAGEDWTLPEGAAIADGAFASVALEDQPSSVLLLRGFGIELPEGARVLGIGVGVSRETADAGSIVDHTVRLVRGDHILSANRAASGTWPAGMARVTYGGADDRWDEDWNAAQISDPSFGVALQVRTEPGAATRNAQVDAVRVDVHYCE